jgi:hypothetical protein
MVDLRPKQFFWGLVVRLIRIPNFQRYGCAREGNAAVVAVITITVD